ncbi:MAG: hypothetical protein HQL74_12970 [Magnetococcales bacterium]|nr:hypothetical protein [Magnetococcales bacterium]
MLPKVSLASAWLVASGVTFFAQWGWAGSALEEATRPYTPTQTIHLGHGNQPVTTPAPLGTNQENQQQSKPVPTDPSAIKSTEQPGDPADTPKETGNK